MSRCQGLGNVSRFCGRPVTCSRCCDEGHHVTCCGKVGDAVKCANCVRVNFKDVKHSVQWRECPCAVIQPSRMINRTKYD